MEDNSDSREPAVIIQDMRVAEESRRPVAVGRLLSDSTVLVTEPLAWLHDQTIDPVVVLTSAEDHDGLVERIGIDSVDIVQPTGNPGGAVAFVRLMHPSRHKAISKRLNRPLFEKLLRSNFDISAAIDAALASETAERAPGSTARSPDAALRISSEFVRNRLAENVRTVGVSTPGDTGLQVCIFFACFDEPGSEPEP